MEFIIFQDLAPNTSAVKIHIQSCYYYRHHKPTTTTTWHKADDYEHAKILAEKFAKDCTKGWRNAKCCTEKVIRHV
tara:strand:+ start:446 stop:673 length:228 start_codon:yes stop_codon:yes gene_type:complete